MPTETIGDYEIEYVGVELLNSQGWGAWVTVYGPSPNPMHRNPLFPRQRVATELCFPDQSAAEQEANKIAHQLVAARIK